MFVCLFVYLFVYVFVCLFVCVVVVVVCVVCCVLMCVVVRCWRCCVGLNWRGWRRLFIVEFCCGSLMVLLCGVDVVLLRLLGV